MGKRKDIQLQPLSTLRASAELPTRGWWQSPLGPPGGMSNGMQEPPSLPLHLESAQNRILPFARTLTVKKMEEKMMLVQNFIMKIVVFGSQEYSCRISKGL
jgi:hypothetical protein